MALSQEGTRQPSRGSLLGLASAFGAKHRNLLELATLIQVEIRFQFVLTRRSSRFSSKTLRLCQITLRTSGTFRFGHFRVTKCAGCVSRLTRPRETPSPLENVGINSLFVTF